MASVARLLPRAFAFVPRLAVARSIHWRRRLVVLGLLVAVLASAYLFWFRDSSLVKVERVQVVGLSTAPDSSRLRAELAGAARHMTTLHLDRGALDSVVADSPVVRTIELRPDFPHGLTIDVVENRPVAVVSSPSGRVPVSADGTMLKGVDVSGSLPVVRTTAEVPTSGRIRPGAALDRVGVAGAAPASLLAKIESITIQPGKGYVAQVAGGPAIWLGGAAQLGLKWSAAAAVLAQQSSQGATYVDVRIPERAVAGGLVIQTDPQPDPSAPATPGTDTGAPPTAQAAPGTTTSTQPTAPAPATPPSAAPPSAVQPATPPQTTTPGTAVNPQP